VADFVRLRGGAMLAGQRHFPRFAHRNQARTIGLTSRLHVADLCFRTTRENSASR
jgi:hypothetical protein